jgi:hypothetical protein
MGAINTLGLRSTKKRPIGRFFVRLNPTLSAINTYPRGKSKVLLQKTPYGALRLGGLEIKVSVGLAAVANLENETGVLGVDLGTELKAEASSERLKVLLLLKVLER